MNISDALDELKTILSAYYEGRDEVRDVIQLRVLSTFLQSYSYSIAQNINNLYISLGKIISDYNNLFFEERRKLQDEYDLDNISEKKIENMLLQKNEMLLKLYNQKNSILNQIRGLENEQKFAGYLNQSLHHLIQKISNEWKMSKES